MHQDLHVHFLNASRAKGHQHQFGGRSNYCQTNLEFQKERNPPPPHQWRPEHFKLGTRRHVFLFMYRLGGMNSLMARTSLEHCRWVRAHPVI
ncbi:hypothetical protein AMATHDRAFT_70702 [Amanita thiersii Skay4041]|uniref:Uncharacterized protein n=1 Tax=Amanita thiersii Skay4041 TaxID=703135 RepID=A0A2A9N9S7_9AGAR|nr:hypothetical protein AMATHDRAFT_70702 [Amanita thiersii Skay4041]